MYLDSLCAIGTCRAPVVGKTKACAHNSHQRYAKSWKSRFRLSFEGIRRLIRSEFDRHHTRTFAAANRPPVNNEPVAPGQQPYRPQMPAGPNGEDGGAVVHRFKASRTHCIETVMVMWFPNWMRQMLCRRISDSGSPDSKQGFSKPGIKT
jgi:hypothetical protein